MSSVTLCQHKSYVDIQNSNFLNFVYTKHVAPFNKHSSQLLVEKHYTHLIPHIALVHFKKSLKKTLAPFKKLVT